ncbi:hypothetical protein PI124_g18038 [Phytophthora idaei]|nr:hypothetical protein PI124_g18038 [Phytophthora idaei]
MKDHFRHFRGLKGVEGVGYGALQESWCAFIRRWNRTVEEDESFVGWLVYREEIIKDHSLSELREHVCSDAWKDMRRICYVRVAEGCESCAGPRPTVEEWKDHIAEYPLSEKERGWIGKYKHSLDENARASSRGGSHRHWSRGRLDRRSRSRTRGRSGHRSRSRSRGRSSHRPRSRSYSPRADPRCYSSLQAWTRTPGPHLGRREGGWHEAPTYLPQEGSRATVPYTDARVGHRERGHDDVWRREEDPRGQQCVQRSSGCLQQRQQQEGDRHAGNARVLAGQDEDDLLNRYWDTQQELDKALDQAARAAGETVQLRQSNREILARLRMLERSVHGQLQNGTQPRDSAPGTDGSMARRARREGRPTYVPAQEAEPTLE